MKIKKLSLLILALIFSLTIAAQEELRFRVILNTIEGVGIKGVNVRIDGIGSATSDNDGFGFFPNLKNSHKKSSGDKIYISAILSDFKTVNNYELSLYTLPKDRSIPINIILTKNKSFEVYIKKYFEDISHISFNKNFDKQEKNYTKQLNDLIKEYQQFGRRPQLDSLILLKRIDSVQSKVNYFNTQKKKQYLIAESIVHTLLDVSVNPKDSILIEAFLLFKEGKYIEAQNILDAKKIEQEKKDVQEVDKLIAAFQESNKQKKQNYISKCLLKAQLYELNSESKEIILNWYEEAYKTDTLNIKTLLSYASFLQTQNTPAKPAVLYQKALLLNLSMEERAFVLNNLGIYYSVNNEFIKVEDKLIESLNYYRQLSKKDSLKFLPYVANTSVNLATYYMTIKENQKAEAKYLDGLQIHYKLVNVNDNQTLLELANILGNIAIFYSTNHEIQNAEEKYLEALKYYRQLYQKDKVKFLPDLGRALNNIGAFYKQKFETKKAVEYYLEALKYLRQAVIANHSQFLPDLANTLNNLGNFYSDNQNKKEADEYYLEALLYYRQLIQINKAQFLPNLATLLNSLGNFYYKNLEKQKAEEYYLEALTYRRQLVTIDKIHFLPDLSINLQSLGLFYANNQNNQKAEIYYLEALKCANQLVQINRERYLLHLASILNNLGLFYLGSFQRQKAEENFLEGLSYYRELYQRNGTQSLSQLINILNNLGAFYFTFDNKKAEEYYLEDVKYCRQLLIIDETQFSPILITALINLSNIYSKKQRQEVLLEALGYTEKLVIKNEDIFLPFLGAILINLGENYSENKDYQNALDNYIRALDCYRQLIKKNEVEFLPNLAKTLFNLGKNFLEIKELKKSEENYLEALKYFKQLYHINNIQYLPFLAKIYNSLGVFYFVNNDRKKAEENYLEAYKYKKQLLQINKEQFLLEFSMTQLNLGQFYSLDYQTIEKGEDLLIQALNNFQNIALQYKSWDGCLEIIAMISETIKRDSSYIRKLLLQKSIIDCYIIYPEKSDLVLAKAYNDASLYSIFCKNFIMAEEYARKGIALDSKNNSLLINLSSSLLLQGKWKETRKIYLEIMNIKYNEKPLKEAILKDLLSFKNFGFNSLNFKKAEKILNK